ncbi:MAG: peptide ABC transporter substrate-binding protein [Opitutaceae bacterium]|nr:peptide ABC transporter substrate-binding protein [Opitutaceae bacterium]
MKTFSRAVARLIFAGLVLALAACQKRETPVTAANRAQILLLGNLSEPNDLDPAYPDSQQTANIVIALMEGLCQYDPRTSLPVPAVAERWEASADQLTWTFHLRSTARWSNGEPLTAKDFVYAYRRNLSAGLGAEYATMLFALKNGREFNEGAVTDFSQVGVEAADDHTLVLRLSHPVPYLPKLLCHTIWFPVHQATVEKFGRIDQRGTHWTRPGNYVGNGPFVLAEWKPNQIVRVTKSPTYWNRDEVRLNGINFYPIEANSTEEAMFRTGQLHVTAQMPIDKIAVYRDDPRLAVFLRQAPMLATYFFRFNTRHKPLDDVRVRQALAHSINRVEMVERVTLGGQPPAMRLTPPGIAGFDPAAKVTYDPELARRLLAEAGYPGGRGFPALEYLYNTNESHRKIAEAIQQMWRRELGINITLVNQEGKVWADTMRAGNFDIARMAWVGDYVDPSTFLDIMTTGNGNNQTGWGSAEYDRLITAATATADEAERYALYARCEQILADGCPIAPLYFYNRNNLVLPAVKGWYNNPVDMHPYTGVSLDASDPRSP